jgi:hypothetical protein
MIGELSKKEEKQGLFNYITGGWVAKPFWNLEEGFDILLTEPSFVNLMSCLLFSNDSMSF